MSVAKAAKCSLAARGFFILFHQWSQQECRPALRGFSKVFSCDRVRHNTTASLSPGERAVLLSATTQSFARSATSALKPSQHGSYLSALEAVHEDSQGAAKLETTVPTNRHLGEESATHRDVASRSQDVRTYVRHCKSGIVRKLAHGGGIEESDALPKDSPRYAAMRLALFAKKRRDEAAPSTDSLSSSRPSAIKYYHSNTVVHNAILHSDSLAPSSKRTSMQRDEKRRKGPVVANIKDLQTSPSALYTSHGSLRENTANQKHKSTHPEALNQERDSLIRKVPPERTYVKSLKIAESSKGANHLEASEPETQIALSVRKTFRYLAQPVVLLTTSLPPYAYRGMTVSSLTSVCLVPIPVVSFNIRKPSATLTALLQSGHFLVHLLHANEDGARIADLFTMGKAGLESAKFERGMSRFNERRWDVDEVKIKGTDGWVLPWVRGNGVSKVLQCEVLNTKVDVGDHVVMFGKVVGMLGDRTAWEDMKMALSYGVNAYRKPGEQISIKSRK